MGIDIKKIISDYKNDAAQKVEDLGGEFFDALAVEENEKILAAFFRAVYEKEGADGLSSIVYINPEALLDCLKEDEIKSIHNVKPELIDFLASAQYITNEKRAVLEQLGYEKETDVREKEVRKDRGKKAIKSKRKAYKEYYKNPKMSLEALCEYDPRNAKKLVSDKLALYALKREKGNAIPYLTNEVLFSKYESIQKSGEDPDGLRNSLRDECIKRNKGMFLFKKAMLFSFKRHGKNDSSLISKINKKYRTPEMYKAAFIQHGGKIEKQLNELLREDSGVFDTIMCTMTHRDLKKMGLYEQSEKERPIDIFLKNRRYFGCLLNVYNYPKKLWFELVKANGIKERGKDDWREVFDLTSELFLKKIKPKDLDFIEEHAGVDGLKFLMNSESALKKNTYAALNERLGELSEPERKATDGKVAKEPPEEEKAIDARQSLKNKRLKLQEPREAEKEAKKEVVPAKQIIAEGDIGDTSIKLHFVPELLEENTTYYAAVVMKFFDADPEGHDGMREFKGDMTISKTHKGKDLYADMDYELIIRGYDKDNNLVDNQRFDLHTQLSRDMNRGEFGAPIPATSR
ncbi:MAG: hypothetical protein LBL34_05350 [Clostridiales bacterium]|nr:hypothetical protein [Clostridiales bacterium]